MHTPQAAAGAACSGPRGLSGRKRLLGHGYLVLLVLPWAYLRHSETHGVISLLRDCLYSREPEKQAEAPREQGCLLGTCLVHTCTSSTCRNSHCTIMVNWLCKGKVLGGAERSLPCVGQLPALPLPEQGHQREAGREGFKTVALLPWTWLRIMEHGSCERPRVLGEGLLALRSLIVQVGQIHSASEDDLLPPHTECWNYRHGQPCSLCCAGDQAQVFYQRFIY